MRLVSWVLAFIVTAAVQPVEIYGGTETIDLKALAKTARPAVLRLVVFDAAGKEIATATGFVVSSDGKLVTNHHVIEDAASAVANAENGGQFAVEGILAGDSENDLALLKIKGRELPFLPLASSEKIAVGTRIAVIGSPLGLEGTLSEGIVSAVRNVKDGFSVLQITAPISPGSSGSPVLNEKGEVLGVASALIAGGQSLNFAVPNKAVAHLIGKATSVTQPQPIAEYLKQWIKTMSTTLRLELGRKYDARIFLTTTEKETFRHIYPDFVEPKAEKDWEWKDVDPVGLFSPSENRQKRREQFLYDHSAKMLLESEGNPRTDQLDFLEYVNKRFSSSTVLMTSTTVKLLVPYTLNYEDVFAHPEKESSMRPLRNALGLTAELGVQWARFGGVSLYIYNGSILISKYFAGHVSLAHPDFDRPLN